MEGYVDQPTRLIAVLRIVTCQPPALEDELDWLPARGGVFRPSLRPTTVIGIHHRLSRGGLEILGRGRSLLLSPGPILALESNSRRRRLLMKTGPPWTWMDAMGLPGC